ncbi:MAG: Na+/H+ antiporter subunit E [Akkermansiaceae bacterium]|jgi:multicomponent Na+:H+ antiporter subunit E|nr:Na+/H+ antiporter subunit E [Akkermansiaceae bacterium]
MKALLIFPFFYLYEVIAGALRVSRDVLSPRPQLRPVLLRVPVDLPSAGHRLMLAALVTMTPGTLSVAETEDGRELLVHSLYGAEDPEKEIRHIQEKYATMVGSLRLPFTRHD